MIERYEFDPAALDEYEEAATFYEKRREGLGVRFVKSVEEAIKSILAAPHAAALWPQTPSRLHLRQRRVRGFPAVFVGYAVADGVVYILAIGHTRRHPGYWRERIRAFLEGC